MTINIERAGNRIHLTSDRKLVRLHKKIPGANFATRGGAHWTLPLTMDSCKLLREAFRRELVIGPELSAWAFARKKRDRELRKLGKAESAELPGLWLSTHPKLFKAVTRGRPYQAVGAKFIAKGRRVIVADTVGLGKTAQTLAGIMESQLPGPYLIVCPKTPVETVWKPEIKRWLPDYNVIYAPEGRAARNRVLDEFASFPTDKDFVVVNQEMLRTRSYWICCKKLEEGRCGSRTPVKAGPKTVDCGHDPKRSILLKEHDYPQLFEIEWSAVIADESDKCLIRKNKTSTQTRKGMEMLRVREDGIKVAQSATPWRSRPHLLWSTLNWLMPDEFTAFWAWAETFYEMEEGFKGAKEIGRLDPDREKLLYRTLSSIMIRRTRQEVAKYLPRRLYIGQPMIPEDEKSLHGVWLPMTPEQERAYREMEEDAEANIRGGEISAVGALAELTRLKQLATSYVQVTELGIRPCLPSNKFDYLVDMLNELGFPDDPQTKVIVVSERTSTLDLFATELKKRHKIDSLMLTGKVSGKKRQEAVRIFNDSDEGPHLLFMNTKAGGSAITLDAADEMVFLDETFVADDQEQCEGRNDNRRPEEKIVQRRYRYLRSIGTIEIGIGYVNQASSSEDRRLLDERRGVQYAIDVLNATFRQDKSTG